MTALQFDSKFLQYFWDLAVASKEVRAKASRSLLESLRDEQKESSSKKLDYTVTRLIRGLGSSRECARQGFSLAFTQILRNFDEVDTVEVLKLMDKFLPLKGNPKDEEKDSYFGRVFCILSLIRSKRLSNIDIKVKVNSENENMSEDESSSDDSNDSDESDESEDEEEEIKEKNSDKGKNKQEITKTKGQSKLIEKLSNPIQFCTSDLLYLANLKLYLRELCYETIILLLNERLEHLDEASFKLVSEHLNNAPISDINPDQFALSIFFQKNFSWVHPSGDILDWDEFKRIPKLLDDACITNSSGVHIAWRQLLNYLLDADYPQSHFNPENVEPLTVDYQPPHNVSQSNFENIQKLWEYIENHLLTGSTNKRALGFRVFQLILPHLDHTQLSSFFKQSFIRQWKYALNSKDPLLRKVATGIFPSISHVIQRNPKAQVIVSQLIHPMNKEFDFSNSKLDNIAKSLNEEGISHLLSHLFNIFYEHENSEEEKTESVDAELSEIDKRRIWVLNQILSLCKNHNITKSPSWVKTCCQFFLFHTFFDVNQETAPKNPSPILKEFIKNIHIFISSPKISDAVRDTAKQRLTSFVTEFNNIKADPSLQKGMINETKFWVEYIIETRKALAKEKSLSLNDSTEDIDDSFTVIKNLTDKIRAKNLRKGDDKYMIFKPIELLAFSCGFMLLIQPDEELPEAISDLSASFEHISKNETDSDEQSPFLVLVDILISLLSRKSLFLRNVVERAFVSISKHLQPEHLTPLFDVIATNSEVVAAEDDEDEDELDFEMDDDDDEDEDDEGDHDSEDSDDDDGDDGANKNSQKGDKKPKTKKAKKPKSNNPETELEDINIDEANEEDMKKLDARLSDYFKIAKAQKRAGKEKKESEEHLKLKVLTLLELYIKRNSSNENVLLLIEAIYNAAVDSDSNKHFPVFSQKVKIVFEKLCKMKELPTMSTEGVEKVQTLLENFMSKITKKRISALTLSYSTSGMRLCLRLLLSKKTQAVKEDALNLEKFNESMKKITSSFATNKNTQIKIKFFTDLINAFPFLCWQSIAGIFIDQLILNGRNDFMVGQGCMLLDQMLKRPTPFAEHKRATLKKIFPIFIDIFSKELPAKRLLVILKTFGACVTATRKLTSGEVSQIADVAPLLDAIDRIKNQYNSSSKVQNILLNIRKMLQVQPTQKRKLEAVNASSSSSDNAQKRKKIKK